MPFGAGRDGDLSIVLARRSELGGEATRPDAAPSISIRLHRSGQNLV
jgi:hypothetical protein